MAPDFDQMMERMGGRSEWTGRVGARVFPTSVTIADDPTMKDFQGQPLLGAYDVDDEGVKGEKVTVVDHGILRDLLMSRRPGPDFEPSNGHARSADLSDTKPLMQQSDASNRRSAQTGRPEKEIPRRLPDDGHQWCLEVKRMDNPALSSVQPGRFLRLHRRRGWGTVAAACGYLCWSIACMWPTGTRNLCAARIIQRRSRFARCGTFPRMGDDAAVFTYMQNSADGFAGTALGAFGSTAGRNSEHGGHALDSD